MSVIKQSFARLTEVASLILHAINTTGVNEHGGIITCSVPDQYVRELEEILSSAVATKSAKWTSMRPEVDGYYWYHRFHEESNKSIVVYVAKGEIIWPASYVDPTAIGRYYGPVATPPMDNMTLDDELPDSDLQSDAIRKKEYIDARRGFTVKRR